MEGTHRHVASVRYIPSIGHDLHASHPPSCPSPLYLLPSLLLSLVPLRVLLLFTFSMKAPMYKRSCPYLSSSPLPTLSLPISYSRTFLHSIQHAPSHALPHHLPLVGSSPPSRSFPSSRSRSLCISYSQIPHATWIFRPRCVYRVRD